MSFINLVSEDQAEPHLKQIYQQIRQSYGFLPNYMQALGSAPQLLEAHFAFGGEIMKDGALSNVVKEQIAVVVSGINSSSYCVAAHMELLRQLGVEKALGRKLATDYANAPVPENVQALFRFADRLTRKPLDIEKADVETLCRAGWNDAAILEATLAVAYFNFVSRVALSLAARRSPQKTLRRCSRST